MIQITDGVNAGSIGARVACVGGAPVNNHAKARVEGVISDSPPCRSTVTREKRTRRVLWAGASSIALLASATFVLTGNAPWQSPTRDIIINGTEQSFHYGQSVRSETAGACSVDSEASNVAEIAQITDAVVLATVIADEPNIEALEDGPTTSSGTFPLQLFLARTLTARVNSTITGQVSADVISIVDLGWIRDPHKNDWYPIGIGKNARLSVGDSAIIPLQTDPDLPGRYAMLCSGALLLRDGKVFNTGSQEAVNQELIGLTGEEAAIHIRNSH